MITRFVEKWTSGKRIRIGCAAILVLCVLTFCLSAFCVQVRIGGEDSKVGASGIQLVLSLIRHFFPSFKTRFVPFAPIVYMSAIVFAVIQIISIVNIVLMTVTVARGKRCKVLWANLFALPAMVISAVGIMCAVSDTLIAVDLRLSYDFRIMFTYILVPFLMLITFIASFLISDKFIPKTVKQLQ